MEPGPSASDVRAREPPDDRYDVVVIGAGIGGLVAGALLARHGRRVLLVEQHTIPGGAATVFRRGDWEFDVGLHYIGGCGPDGIFSRILRAAGLPDLEFVELDPDGYDVYAFPDLEFRVPRGLDRYRERLEDLFPAERRGIHRWARLLEQMGRVFAAWPRPLALAGALARSPMLVRWSRATLADFLASCTRDARLAALLAAPHIGYALPPSRASVLVGAGIVQHYLEGAYYPRGGGQVLSDALADVIEREGGRVLLRSRVERIVVREDRVAGVELSGRFLDHRLVEAPLVVSNADLKRTVDELLGGGGLDRATVGAVRAYDMAPALGVLYLGLRRELPGRGVNWWVHPSWDLETPYAEAAAGRFSAEPCAFVTASSLKDPDHAAAAPAGCVNVQAMTVAPAGAGAWGVPPADEGSYRRHGAYREAKQALGRRLLATTARVLPGAEDQVVFHEVATPLTHGRYTLASGGTSYGIAATPGQFLSRRPGPRTELPGLILSGASCRTGHGIVGAAASGLAAAAAILPGHLDREVLRPLRTG